MKDKKRMLTSTKQLWFFAICATIATFFLLYIGLVRGNDPNFWLTFPASEAAIWGFVYKMYDSNNKRKIGIDKGNNNVTSNN